MARPGRLARRRDRRDAGRRGSGDVRTIAHRRRSAPGSRRPRPCRSRATTMSVTFELNPSRADAWSEGIAAAAAALEGGALVVLPTETVYGIACRPDLPEA